MYLRETPDVTLSDLSDSLEARPGTAHRAGNDAITVTLTKGDREIKINETVVPATTQGIEAMAAWLDIPRPFLLRQPSDLQEHILNSLLVHNPNEGIWRASDDGLTEIYGPDQAIIEPRAIVDLMRRTIDDKAGVVEFRSNAEEFRLDTMVPEGFDRGVGGDKPASRQVGDLTHGGVRVFQNRKQNHAPQLSEFYYRLACTNGMEVQVEGERIDMRRQTVDEVMAEIEEQAQRIMGRLDERIARFYSLREERVARPEQALLRMAEERNISDRVVTELVRLVPTITDEQGVTTQFDLVNLVTNMANEPSIARREGSRLLLERAGGATVLDHAERCKSCASRLDH